ncbi:MAG: DUF5686 and carboxypeptidase regulatory-like domain-containing protein [Bacteroidota bacterium]
MLNRSLFPVILRTLLVVWSVTGAAQSGGIRGRVTGDDGKPLPYASIFVRQTGAGAATDLSGNYEMPLPPGNYEVLFQYLGFETKAEQVTVGQEMVNRNIVLKTQSVQLQTITVHGRREDPAYAVMRKAIARARYHLQQVDSFSAKVYIKGKGKLKDYPWLAKKALEKEGITKDRLFIQESVSEIRYRRPNKYSEKVIAIYTQGKNNTSGPNEYVFGSLYEPEIADIISPLSSKAFSYYRFEYAGIFKDRQYEVNRIKVIPRSKGDNVFEGTISIVEDAWSIHSVDLKTEKLGVLVDMKQIYNPIAGTGNIQGQAWMPVNQQFKFEGSVFGFDFEGQYLATIKDYRIFLNPALKQELTVVDERTAPPAAPAKTPARAQRTVETKKKLEEGKEVTDKELNQLLRSMEKEDLKQRPDADVMSDRTFKVDSLARKRDSLFWMDVRPAKLEAEEVRGYIKADSIATIEKKRQEGDSAKESRSKGFQLYDLILGDRYRIGETTDLTIRTPYGGFNTVEGFHLIYRLGYSRRWVVRDTLHPEVAPRVTRLDITPVFRYSAERNVLTGLLRADLRTPKGRLTIQAGRYVQQLNPDDPIHPVVNSFTSLMFMQNFMKILERDFAEVAWRYRFNDKYSLVTKWSWNDRQELFNNTGYTLFPRKENHYTPNAPDNLELLSTGFPRHQALLGSLTFEARPWQRYRIRNGRKYRIDGSPVLTLKYRKGFNGMLGSDVDYDLLEAGVRHGFKWGFRGRLDYRASAGMFLNDRKLFFPDFQHFSGNQAFIMTSDAMAAFRLLDYYRYSTKDRYASLMAHYHFRKFLVTRMPKVRLMGVKENLFVNWLTTPVAGNYVEAGYGLDGILRIFRLEGAVAFRNGSQLPVGFRIGISGNLSANFGD